jgi:hypothetical protein
MSKDAFYFPHDSNSRRDPKIVGMMSIYGSSGYGWFWMIVEMMREQDGYRLPIDKKYSFNTIAIELNEDVDSIRDFIGECVDEFELFVIEDGYLYSDSLIERMRPLEEKRARAKSAANKRWGKSKKKEKPLFDLEGENIPPDVGAETKFLEIFNRCKKEVLPKSKGHDSLSTTAKKNLKKLRRRYKDWGMFDGAIFEMLQNKWAHDTGNTTPAHILVEDNFDRYYNKALSRIESGGKFVANGSNLSYDEIMNE